METRLPGFGIGMVWGYHVSPTLGLGIVPPGYWIFVDKVFMPSSEKLMNSNMSSRPLLIILLDVGAVTFIMSSKKVHIAAAAIFVDVYYLILLTIKILKK